MPEVTLPTGPTVHYTDNGNGVPLLLGHGFMLDQTLFNPMSPLLEARCRLIRWDSRGHGKTRYDGRPFGQWDNVEDMIALMDQLGLQSAVIGGHSQGGFMALSTALRYPDRVKALVLINTTPHGQSVNSFAELKDFMTLWKSQGPTEELCRAIGEMVLGSSNLKPWIRKWQCQPEQTLTHPLRAVMEREDLSDRLDQIDVPTLVIHSTNDAGIPLSEAEEYTRQLPNAEPLFVVNGAPHASCWTHPREVGQRIIGFLDRL